MATEENLAQWVQSMRTDGVPVTPRMIQLVVVSRLQEADIIDPQDDMDMYNDEE
ncbi:hypothetical protein H310_09764 [Aphanomyces invadans]|uniref:HTH CENPB-type domain-containing protein n=1 Tax=Aphanomyces invadans TaxID=157072 RepID=A0A024TV06_9STRA|nr:hypothetical protein H310_09764 [Aphanomyces invadans]ETV97436.1 hypothetical protein H310_09764 [Aphanomyces invadans]|eukprot:XP_008874144.1 hypothetical protein H310_09764 [Aphanomyces invadans]